LLPNLWAGVAEGYGELSGSFAVVSLKMTFKRSRADCAYWQHASEQPPHCVAQPHWGQTYSTTKWYVGFWIFSSFFSAICFVFTYAAVGIHEQRHSAQWPQLQLQQLVQRLLGPRTQKSSHLQQ